jgi:hypothetical protein
MFAREPNVNGRQKSILKAIADYQPISGRNDRGIIFSGEHHPSGPENALQARAGLAPAQDGSARIRSSLSGLGARYAQCRKVSEREGVLVNNEEHARVVNELKDYWGAKPNDRCYCGCGESTSTGRYFASGHDSRFAANLLADLRCNQQVAEAIQSLVAGTHKR